MSENVKHTILRFAVVFGIILVLFVVVFARIISLQTVHRAELEAKVAHRDSVYRTDKGIRGNIFDCEGRLLASSVPQYSIHMDTRVEALHLGGDTLFWQYVDTLANGFSRIIGDKSAFTERLQNKIETAELISLGKPCKLCVALNYGGRDEIIRAAKAFAQDVAEGKRTADSLTELDFSGYLDSAGVPDPELVIRPSGELRTSNFLPWQTVYSEFVYMDILWPDFGPKDLDAAIAEYNRRNRRFGGA